MNSSNETRCYNFKSCSTGQTKKIAAGLAKKCMRIAQPSPAARGMRKRPHEYKNALVFALTGDLGSGKTTFVQGFLKALGIRKKITSPTFVIFKRFKVKGLRFKNIYHIDCYRIQKPNDLLILGLKEILNNPQNIVLIEWAEKVKRILPKNTIWLKFEHGKKENIRDIRIYS